MSPLISIIVPVYNSEKFLGRCVESILAQTYREFELLLIDDGATDQSGKVCDDYEKKDSRVRVFHEKNGGVSRARNLGLKNAKGELLAFVDSDDYVREDYLEKMYEKLSADVDLVVLGYKNVWPNGAPQWYKEKEVDESFTSLCELKKENEVKVSDFLEHEIFNYLFAKLYRTSIIKEHGLAFDEALCYGEDTVFVMNYLSYCRSICVGKAQVYFYVRYGSGTLSTARKSFFGERMMICEQSEKAMKSLELYCGNVVKAIARRRLRSAYWEVESLGRNIRIGWGKRYRKIKEILQLQEIRKALKSLSSEESKEYNILRKKNINLYMFSCLLKKIYNRFVHY